MSADHAGPPEGNAQPAQLRHIPPYAVLQAAAKIDAATGDITLPLAVLKKYIKSILVQTPFDEDFYRIENPGVVASVQLGHRKNYKWHFIEHGYFEGRIPALYYFPEMEDTPEARPIPHQYFAALCDAQDLAYEGKQGESIDLLRQAAQLYPKAFYANYLAGAMLCSQFRLLDALGYLSQALVALPYRPEPMHRLISILRLFNNPAYSVKLLNDLAARLAATPAWLVLATASMYFALGDFRSARLQIAKLQTLACTEDLRNRADALAKSLAEERRKLKQLKDASRCGVLPHAEFLRALLLLAQFGHGALATRLYEQRSAPPQEAKARVSGEVVLRLRVHEALYGGPAALAEAARLAASAGDQAAEVLQARVEILSRLCRYRDICSLIDDPATFPFRSGIAYLAAFALLHEKAYVRLEQFCKAWHDLSLEKWKAHQYLVLCAFSRGLLEGIHLDRKLVHRQITEPDADPFESAIPKTILQFWDKSPPPAEIQAIADEWRDKNPHFTYILFNEGTARNLIEDQYGTEILALFDYCHHSAMKADLFRLLYLNKFGGYYVDADDGYIEGFTWLTRHAGTAELVVVTGYSRADEAPPLHLNNLFIGAVPGHAVIAGAMRHAIETLKQAAGKGSKPDIWSTTGPGALTRGFQLLLLSDAATKEAIMPRIRVVAGPSHFEFIARTMPLSYKGTVAGNWRLA